MKIKYSFNGLLVALFALMLFSSCLKKNADDNDTSWALVPFVKADSMNPVLLPGAAVFHSPILNKDVKWEERDVFNPAAVVRNDTVFLLYRAQDKIAGTSRIGLAFSLDGFHFTKRATPVLFPANDFMKVYEWEGGIEDPRVILREDGTYVMTYTSYDGTTARLCVASSRDLIHWKKKGLVLTGKYKDGWSKSGAIVGERKGERIVAKKINGKYWMYFGDTDLFMATSDDLIHWQPLEEKGKLKPVLKPREKHFDSRLVESGPVALYTSKGILLLYNGMNLDKGGDNTVTKEAYCGGQALFSSSDPSLLINRLKENFMRPEKSYEINGQVNQVCFIEGLIPFQGKWFLYYGTADSKIAVAVCEGVVL